MDFVDERLRVFAVGFCQENITSAGEVIDGFAQNSAREHQSVSERIGFIDEQKVDGTAKRQVLHSVVENDDVNAEAANGVFSGVNAVAVNDDANTAGNKVAREHVRFVACDIRSAQNIFPVGNHARERALSQIQPTQNAAPHRFFFGFVAAGKNRDLTSVGRHDARHFFDNRRFSRAADGQIAHDDDFTPERRIPQNAVAVEEKAQLYNAGKQDREHAQKCGKRPCGSAVRCAVVNHIRDELFKTFAE